MLTNCANNYRCLKKATSTPSQMPTKDVPVISSPPRIKRLLPCRSFGNDRNRVSKTITFDIDARDDTQCDVGARGEGQVGDSGSSLRLPMSFEEVDEETGIGGGCYYNMSRPHGMSSNTLSYQQRYVMKEKGGSDSSTSTDMCRRYYPFPFIILCILFLFGIGEMLRKVSRTHGGVD